MGECDVDRSNAAFIPSQVLRFAFGCVAVATKRCIETKCSKSTRPYRPLIDFALDASKLLCGELLVYALGLLCAGIHQDHCAYYLASNILDNTLGVGLLFVFLHASSFFLRYWIGDEASWDWRSGDFRDERLGQRISMRRFFKQTFLWLVLVTLSKLAVYLVLFIASVLVDLAGAFLSLFPHHQLQTWIVLFFFPAVFKPIRFWMLDNIIKKPTRRQQSSTTDEVPEDTQLPEAETTGVEAETTGVEADTEGGGGNDVPEGALGMGTGKGKGKGPVKGKGNGKGKGKVQSGKRTRAQNVGDRFLHVIDSLRCGGDSKVCCICMEEMEIPPVQVTDLQQTRCKHWFHAKCIQEWREKQNNKCPLCRRPLTIYERDQHDGGFRLRFIEASF